MSNNSITLTEVESKRILKDFGIPLVLEKQVPDIESAIDFAESIGYPVVLKGVGPKLAHKTERGIVHQWIASQKDLRLAADAIAKATQHDELTGLLVQPQIKGKRELVAGLFQDNQFGPVIMFGIGGIYTEAIQDITFRVAPLTEIDASEMIDEIRAKAILGAFRGEQSVKKDQLIKVLMGLSSLASQRPDIMEIDINPLIVSPDGDLTAVDALVVIGEQKIKQSLPPIDPYKLGALFYPRSIAFVGASAKFGKWGNHLFTNTVSGGYKGNIYLVNPKGGTIAGRPVYTSVKEIPGSIDLAIVTIPSAQVEELIPEFQEKGIKGMLLISSGFREIGKDGEQLEQRLIEKARKAGIIILGPNTMGICNPHIDLYSNAVHFYPTPGSTSLVSQSGNMGTQLLAFAQQQGIGIRAFSGSGNEAMVTIEDYMESFELDELTSTVVMYLESVKNGRRFFESAKRLSKRKPIVVLKGGRTQVGLKAASSHTGALASDSRVFDAACRQAGIIQVNQPMDLLDLSAVFSSIPMPKGKRVAIMTLGGGWGVVTSDLCAENGLEVVPLSHDIIDKFDKMLPPYWSRSNPLDLVGENDPKLPMAGLEMLCEWSGCDAILHLGIHGKRIFGGQMVESTQKADPEYPQTVLDAIKIHLVQFEEDYIAHIISLMETWEKPIIGVGLVTDEKSQTLYSLPNNKYKAVFFPSPERAVKSLSKMCRYGNWAKIHNQSL